MQNFVYPIGDPQTRDCVAVDAAWNIGEIVERPRPSPTRSGTIR